MQLIELMKSKKVISIKLDITFFLCCTVVWFVLMFSNRFYYYQIAIDLI